MDHLLNTTATINSLTEANSGGDVSQSAVALYTDIPTRINDLNYADQRFIESKEEYSDITKKAFIQSDYTGIEVGMEYISNGKSYIIVFIKELYQTQDLHHFELYLKINEPS